MAKSNTFNQLQRIKEDLNKITQSYEDLITDIMKYKAIPSSPDNVRRFKELHQELSVLQVKMEMIGEGSTFNERVERAKISGKIDEYLQYINSHIRIYNFYL